MAKFSDLSLRAQRELMEEYRNKGINDLSDMIADYEKEVPSDTASSGTSVSVPFSLAETYRNGGKIHIKPENRGKFTALKKRTGHSASWFKAHGTPAQKKMAVFALNARKWKHGDGGFLKNYFEDGGPDDSGYPEWHNGEIRQGKPFNTIDISMMIVRQLVKTYM